MYKAAELRTKSREELLKIISELKGKLLALRFESATGQLTETHLPSTTKKQIALVFTILKEKEIEEFKNNNNDVEKATTNNSVKNKKQVITLAPIEIKEIKPKPQKEKTIKLNKTLKTISKETLASYDFSDLIKYKSRHKDLNIEVEVNEKKLSLDKEKK